LSSLSLWPSTSGGFVKMAEFPDLCDQEDI